MSDSLKPLPEQRYAEELAALAAHDTGPKPAGWRLSPRGVRTFICGSGNKRLTKGAPVISRKYYGDDTLVER